LTVKTHQVLRVRFGTVPDDLGAALKPVYDIQKLSNLLELAVRCPDPEAFRSQLLF
jgi:hypothetical protein